MNPQSTHRYLKIVLAVLVLVLLLLCVFLVRQYHMASPPPVAHMNHPHSLNADDVSLIEPWMTFGYVSTSYKVPNSYLETALGISSSTPHYPNITLAHYAKAIATTSIAVTQSVRAAVQDYLNQSGD